MSFLDNKQTYGTSFPTSAANTVGQDWLGMTNYDTGGVDAFTNLNMSLDSEYKGLGAKGMLDLNKGDYNASDGNGWLNMDNWAKGTQAFTNLMGAYFGMKQYGLAKKGLNHQIGLDKANFENQRALLQERLSNQHTLRQHERPDLWGNQAQTQLQSYGG